MQSSENRQNNLFRYERKFFIYNLNRKFLENIIMHHPAMFSEIYHERHINNIYFDYLDQKNFFDNIDGNANRVKHRIRWYGNMFMKIKTPILELKIKKGMVGTKKHHYLKQFELTMGVNLSELKGVINDSEIDAKVKLSLKEQFPVMINRYKRKYFVSENRKFRITVDSEQSFYKLNMFNNTFLQKHNDLSNTIVELKYDIEDDLEAAQITNKLPFRLTKSSKYARGLELLYY